MRSAGFANTSDGFEDVDDEVGSGFEVGDAETFEPHLVCFVFLVHDDEVGSGGNDGFVVELAKTANLRKCTGGFGVEAMGGDSDELVAETEGVDGFGDIGREVYDPFGWAIQRGGLRWLPAAAEQ